jgi:hypothetical protein
MMETETPKLNLKGLGLVDAEILWKEGNLFKVIIKSIGDGLELTKPFTEVIHVSEILNFQEIYINKYLKISIYDINKS